jgi:hypothetical protein
MNTVVTPLPLNPAAPASDRVFAAAPRRWLKQAGAALLRSMEASGRARAQWHLLEFADRCQAQQPELAKELRAAASRQRTAG